MQTTESSLQNKEERSVALAAFNVTLNEMLKKKKVLSVSAPNDNDVLCGRGHFANRHPGNVLLRSIIKAFRLDYVMSLKKDKKHFSEVIVRKIGDQDPPGRFLKRDPKTDTWIDIGHKKTLTKIRQALRDDAYKISKEELDKARNKQQRKIVSHSSVKAEEIEKASVEKMKKRPSKSSNSIPCNSVVTSSKCTRLYYSSEEIYSSEFIPTD